MVTLAEFRKQLESAEVLGQIAITDGRESCSIPAGPAHLLSIIPAEGIGPNNIDRVVQESRFGCDAKTLLSWIQDWLMPNRLVEEVKADEYVVYSRGPKRKKYGFPFRVEDFPSEEIAHAYYLTPQYSAVSRAQIISKAQHSNRYPIESDKAIKHLEGFLVKNDFITIEKTHLGLYMTTGIARRGQYEAVPAEHNIGRMIMDLSEHEHFVSHRQVRISDDEYVFSPYGSSFRRLPVSFEDECTDKCLGPDEDRTDQIKEQILSQKESAISLLAAALYYERFYQQYHPLGRLPEHGVCRRKFGDESVRDLLIEIGSPAVATLLEYAEKTDFHYRCASLSCLMQIGNKKAGELFKSLLKDKDTHTRVQAQYEVEFFQDPVQLPWLVEMVLNKDNDKPKIDGRYLVRGICKIAYFHPKEAREILKDNFGKLVSHPSSYAHYLFEMAGETFTREDKHVLETLKYYGSRRSHLWAKAFQRSDCALLNTMYYDGATARAAYRQIKKRA